MPLLPYRDIPSGDPGTPDIRSPWRFLLWIGRRQLRLIIGGTLFGVIWMLSQALLWAAVGVAVEKGLQHHDTHALVKWSLVIVGLGVTQAIAGAIRHQIAITNWMTASFRTVQLVGRHLGVTGVGVTDVVPSGDVVATVAADAMRIGGAYDVIPRFIGAIVAWIVVAIILITSAGSLGIMVLVGVPLLAAFTIPLQKPLHNTQAAQREASGRLTAAGTDTVSGLRILRGIGGEDVFYNNYVAISQDVRSTGNAVSTPQAIMESGQVLLPAILTVLITWVGATRVLHHSLQAGQLVAFFGYATFLTLPLRTVIEYIIASTRAVVGARKVIAVLSTQPAVPTPPNPLPWPTSASVLRDPVSKVTVPLGKFVGLVTETPAAAQHIVDQLTRFDVDSQATLDDVPLSTFALKDVRSNLVVSEIEPRMFAGTLRSEIALAGKRDDASIEAALFTAGADDILTSADDGLSVRIEERGRNFSGGQRQRLALARAVATDANVLLLIEPTSAVDAHTESRIATRLVETRRGRSTVVSTTSPLLLEHCDVVIFVEPSGEVVAGTHRELASSSTTYRAAILRSDFA